MKLKKKIVLLLPTLVLTTLTVACFNEVKDSNIKKSSDANSNYAVINELNNENFNLRQQIDDLLTNYKSNEELLPQLIEDQSSIKKEWSLLKDTIEKKTFIIQTNENKRQELFAQLPRLYPNEQENKLIAQLKIKINLEAENYTSEKAKINEIFKQIIKLNETLIADEQAQERTKQDYKRSNENLKENESRIAKLTSEQITIRSEVKKIIKKIESNYEKLVLLKAKSKLNITEVKDEIDKTIENPDHPAEPNPPVDPSPNPEPSNPDTENGDNNQPTPPPVFPNFPTYDAAAHSYPSYVSNFTKLNPNDIYSEIYDLTFSFKYSWNEPSANGNNVIGDISQGTAWLIDYHQYANSNRYKLFMATNMHVLDYFGNTLSEELLTKLNYKDPLNGSVHSFAIGKTQNRPSNFDAIPNNSYDRYKQVKGGSTVYKSSTSGAMSNPEIIFAGIDFMDKSIYDLAKVNEYKEKYKELINSDEASAKTKKINYLNTLDYIPYYTDFGIFAFDIDLDNTSDQTLREWITNAKNALDQYILRNKQRNLPNHKTSDLPFFTVDYMSKSSNLLANNSYYQVYNEFALYNAKDVYIGGYPRNTNRETYWMQNNPTERNDENLTTYFRSPNNKNAFSYATNDTEAKVVNNNVQVYTKVWNRPLLSFYGNNYNIKFSSLYFGASGSVVYNEFGQIIGIYNGVQASTAFGDLLKNATFAPLIQAGDFVVIGENTNQKMYAYNLIDATNKDLYPKQTKSYRENLRQIYKTGFTDGTKTTALFIKGF
ncbi:MIP family Ig-specific serine endopeptidase [Mycoplasmopsis gallinarum]|uniref:DUF31 domain-containing protein n=1 Tax=Mycoplasmopsis gallinarum TaxID=29557 RepID=A0A168RGD2_9BACT|nr:DUF31 family protein [Mycoplasmopsis gallinarum]OAB48959.1 hypothetical protein MGALLINA_02910 [Mycoplasmopsis gallinarum]